MKQLYYGPGNASLAPHIVLEESGLPFTLKLVDRAGGELNSPAYRKLNPNGLIPVFVDGDQVMFEATAICLHVAEQAAGKALAPPVGSAERMAYLQWMVWLSNTLQAMLMQYFHPTRMVDEGDANAADQVKRQAEARTGALLDLLDAHFTAHGGPWLLGATYSTADAYAFMLCRWSRGFARPARALPNLGPFLERMLARPAVQAVLAREGLSAPYV